MNTIPVKRLLCLLLALILCVGAMPPAASAQETAVSLPESIDDFHMKAAIECHIIDFYSADPKWVLQVFPTEYNYPISGIKLVFEYDRDLAGFNAIDSTPRNRYDHAEADSNRDSQICIGTVTGSSDTPISFLQQSLADLYFLRSPFTLEEKAFDFRITELTVYVPLADGTVAEYTPDYPASFHVPLMDYDGSYIHLGPEQTAASADWVDWGGVTPGYPSLWYLQQDGTLTITGYSDIPMFTDSTPAPWQQYRDQIKKVVIRDGMRNIGDYAFSGYPKLEEVVFPSQYSCIGADRFYIGDSAFEGCTSLRKVSALPVPDNATLFLGSRTFAGTALETFHIPKDVDVAYDTFADSYSMTCFTVDPNINYSVDPYGALIHYRNGSDCLIYGFPKGMQGEYRVPYDLEELAPEAFANCQGLTKIYLTFINHIESGTFRNCSATEIYFPRQSPNTIAADAFENVTATVYYDPDSPGWTEEIMQQYGGNLTWVPHTHEYTVEGKEPTCTENGAATYSCHLCGYYYEIANIGSVLGHDLGEAVLTKAPTCVEDGIETRYCSRCDYSEDAFVLPTGHSWADTDQEGIHSCTVCGHTEGKYRLRMPSNTPDYAQTAWVDGVEYPIQQEIYRYIAIPHPNGTSLSVFKYHNAESEDVHTQYPSVMHTWLIEWTEDFGQYYAADVFNMFHYSTLRYAGCSIRIKGVKGIRMISGVHEQTRKLLTRQGYQVGSRVLKLVEYGTLLAWASDLEGGNPLTLGQPYVKSNYAYKKDVADPIYKRDAQNIYYTNVLVGFTNEQCKDDLAMRPYMIIEDQNGRQTTIYGGIIYRSIGYIAYQNRAAFQPGTAAYEYVWDIIHYVYGDQYDAEYKGKTS